MSNFKIGEKVVCVDANNIFNETLTIQSDAIVKGEIYTIKSFNSVGGLVLLEIYNGVFFDGETGGFRESRFRKLDHGFGEKICAEILESIKVDELQYN